MIEEEEKGSLCLMRVILNSKGEWDKVRSVT